MEFKGALIFALINMAPAIVFGATIKYEHPGRNLTHIPNDIPADVNIITLSRNLIPVVDYMPGIYPSIRRVNIDYNLLKVFPELSNCTSVSILDVGYNQITTIPPDRLNALTELKDLYLRGNHLVAFPDVSGPSASIRSIWKPITLRKFPFWTNWEGVWIL